MTFEGKNLTANGGLLPLATMLEKAGISATGEGTLPVKQVTRGHACVPVRSGHGVGLRFPAHEPMLAGLLKPLRLPVQR